MADATLEFAQQIIARPSLTPDDAGCQRLLADRLERLGFASEFIERNGVTNRAWLEQLMATEGQQVEAVESVKSVPQGTMVKP